MKHIPGPWKSAHGVIYFSAGYGHINMSHCPLAVDTAHLIAATPELVAALRRIASTTGSDDPCRWMVDLAREALTKAGL